MVVAVVLFVALSSFRTSFLSHFASACRLRLGQSSRKSRAARAEHAKQAVKSGTRRRTRSRRPELAPFSPFFVLSARNAVDRV